MKMYSEFTYKVHVNIYLKFSESGTGFEKWSVVSFHRPPKLQSNNCNVMLDQGEGLVSYQPSKSKLNEDILARSHLKHTL